MRNNHAAAAVGFALMALAAAGANVIVASDQLRAILDVLISSQSALKNRPAALQAVIQVWQINQRQRRIMRWP